VVSGDATQTLTRASQVGVYLTSRTSTTRLDLYRRSKTTFASVANNTSNVSAYDPASTDLTAMSQGTAIYSDGRYFAFGILAGTSSGYAENLSLAVYNLWKTLTGLDLP
jgi:hypothetical protein